MSGVDEVKLPDDAGHALRGNKVKVGKGKSRKKSDPLVPNVTRPISSSLTFVSPDKSVEKLTNTSPKTDTLQQKTLEEFLSKGTATNSNDYCAENNQSNCKQLTERMSKVITINSKVKNNVNDDEEYKSSSDSSINNVDFNKKYAHGISASTRGKRRKIKKKSGLSLKHSDGVCKDSRERASNKSDEVLTVDEDSSECSAEKKKLKNAFQFMMEVRNRSIGQNLSGKDAQLVQSDVSFEDKQKLVARRAVFEKWANNKGGLKRKMEEEEKDILIKQKLKLRARRLKKLLNVSTENDRIKTVKTRKKRKLAKRVLAHSEDSTDYFTDESNETRENEDLKCNSFSNKHLEENVIEIIEDPAIDSKSKKVLHQKELSTFFEVVEGTGNKLKIITRGRSSNDTDEENLNIIKIKMYSPGVFKRRRKRTSHNGELGENAKSPCEGERIENSSISSNEEMKTDDNNHKFVGNKKQFEIREQKSSESVCKIVTAINGDVACASGSKNKENCECYETRKSIRPKKDKLKDAAKDKYVPISSKKKSTASVSDGALEKIKSVDKYGNVTHKTTRIDDSHTNNQYNCRRSARQIAKMQNNVPIFEIDSDGSNDLIVRKNTLKTQKKTQKFIKVAPIFTNVKRRDSLAKEARKNFLLSGVPETLKKYVEKCKR